MNVSPFAATLLVLSTLGTTISGISPIWAQTPKPETNFFCGQVDGIPATIANTPRGEVVMIKWTQDMGAYNPQLRCQMVSQRFQSFYASKSLRFLTSGKMNGQRVICVAQNKFAGCMPKGLLFTLRPGDDDRQFLANLLNQSKYASAPAILNQCMAKKDYAAGTGEVYIQLDEFLYQCPPELTATPQP